MSNMGTHHIVTLRVLIVNTLLLIRAVQSAENVVPGAKPPPTTPQSPKELDYNCMTAKNMVFDTKMLPQNYHELKKFSVQHCDKVDFHLHESEELLQWKEILFRNIGTLRLRLTQLPTQIDFIKLDNVTLDDMSILQQHLQDTATIDTLLIRNSVLKNIIADTFINPTFQNVTFYNVTFHTLNSKGLTFNFGENSSFKIAKSSFQNDVLQNAITTYNATCVTIEDTTFSSKLMNNSIDITAQESITLKNLTFAELQEKSFVLSAPTVKLINNSFHKIAPNSIILSDFDKIAVVNNTFQQKVKNPISWELQDQKYFTQFVGNSFPCDPTYTGDATALMIDTIERFATQNQTFCYLLDLNSCSQCNCDTTNLFDDIRRNKNCSLINSSNTSPKHASTFILVVNVIILKIFQD